MSKITITNQSEPTTPTSGKTAIYVDATSKLFSSKNDSGVVATYGASDAAYGAGWDGDIGPASKNAIYDKIETLGGGGGVDDHGGLSGLADDDHPQYLLAATAMAESANQDIGASGTITLNSAYRQILNVTGDGGAQTASTAPFGATPPVACTEITVVGTSDSNTVTIPNSDTADGCLLNGAAVLGANKSITLTYSLVRDRYIEKGRNF